MNGRIYDPTLGRFLQADPHIQAPNNSQSYNRYSYVLNNPLSYTDPSGFFFNKLFKSINKLLGDFAPLVSIGLTIWAPWGTGFWASVGTGAIAGGIATGSLRGALTGAFTAGMFHGIGTHFEGLGDSAGVLSRGAKFGKTLAHGIAGGVSSVLSGGKFGHGFASAGFTQAFAGAIDGIGGRIGNVTSGGYFDSINRVKRIVAAAVVGGTASQLTGGKFANGAITGAFSRGFNDEAHFKAKEQSFWDEFKEGAGAVRDWTIDNGGALVTTVGGGAQVFAGSVLCSTGLGCVPGSILIAHGANNIIEGVSSIGGRPTDGPLRQGYRALSTSLGYSSVHGDLAYGVVDVGTSFHGITKMVLKPDAWKLFRHIPSDYTRTVAAGPLMMNAGTGAFTTFDTLNRVNGN